MAFILSDTKKSFPPPPEGILRAVCVDVVDLGKVEGPFGLQHKLQITWQTEDRDEKGKRFLVIRTYTASLNEKSKLRPMLESWRGKKFTAEELIGWDIEKLIGANCQLQIIHRLRTDGSQGYDVQAVITAPKGMPLLKPEDYTRKKDRVENEVPAEDGEDEEGALPF